VSLRDLLVLYGVAGIACAVATVRKAPITNLRAIGSAVASMLLWPLWAPFALGGATRSYAPSQTSSSVVARIERALAGAVEAVAGTPMSEMFSPRVALPNP
jgi:hypothetical protein